jgi:hypothetical protein
MAIVVNNPAAGNFAANYGMFEDNTTQLSGGSTSANLMLLGTTDYSNGVSVVSGSRITIATTGIYNIQFSAQFARAAGIGFATVEVWLAKNGANVAGSNGQVNVPLSGGRNIAAWNYLADVSSGDYFQLYWSSTDANIELLASAAGTNPTRPTTPSIIVTVTQVT